MSYDYDSSDYPEPDGTCHDCGIALDDDPGGDHDETHRQCWACWRGGRGIEEPAWRKPRPAPGTPPTSFVVGLNELRKQVERLERRVAQLERGRVA